MRIKMLRGYGAYKPGELLDLPQAQAEGLIAWEYAVAVRGDEQRMIETACVEPVAEQADVTPRKRKP